MPDPTFSSLPDWVTDALREPVASTPAARTRIMEAVRATARPRRLSAPVARSRWLRRGLLSPVGGLLTTAFLTATLMLRMGSMEGLMGRSVADVQTAAFVLGDSVVPVSPIVATPARMDGATPLSTRLLDTLRIVEFVIRGSSVHAASVLGDFNAWKRGATPLRAVGGDEWRARVLVPRDAVPTVRTVAYLINNSQLIPAAAATTQDWESRE
jgi:hypothetical protein